ncbi:MAG: T9SS type A sorting domain-containing protein [Candidatus Latescibacteria bacterium]|nr:T9SS type A sorting domain-containing protein [Candidatus Latescibacterota bacterium]NIO55416.1 T9SS type A sorting domain-containing protein [Candidatus Latescibacterota bacterium]
MFFRKCFLIVLFILLISPAAWGEDLIHLWSQRFGDGNGQFGRSVTVDNLGNVIVTGYFSGTVDFGGGPLTSAGSSDIFVAKFDPCGTHIWSHRFGDADGQFALSCTVDSMGNIVVTGEFWGTVDFGGEPLTSAGAKDIYVAKFDASGNHLWSQRFGDAGSQVAWSITTDSPGSVIVTGYFDNTVDFGGGILTSAGLLDIFVVKFDSGGNHLWSQRFGDATNQRAYSVTVDDSGNVVVTGFLEGTVDFGGGILTSAGLEDIFVAKFDPGGNHLWSRHFGDAGYQVAWSIVTDGSGNVIITGHFNNTVDFGGGPLTGAGGTDIFVAKFDSSGNHVWSQRFGDSTSQDAYSVAVDGSGNVVVTGYFVGTVDFGGGPLTSAGYNDIYVAKFDSGGNHIWSQRFGDSDDQLAESVVADGSGNVVVTGYFMGTVDFGGGPLTSVALDDIFLVKFGLTGMDYMVTNTGDSGCGSLRQAITCANADTSMNNIIFDIPGPGPHTIQPDSALPYLTSPDVIDGYTQPGAAPNTSGPFIPGNAVLKIELSGAGLPPNDYSNGLLLAGDSTVVRGLVINSWPGAGISVSSDYNIIEGNYIGTDTSGTVALANRDGIILLNNITGNRIGGTSPGERNIISASLEHNIVLTFGSNGTQIEGNFIGTDVTGTLAVGSAGHGIAITNAWDNTIGGFEAGAGNIIAFNGFRGISPISNMATGNAIHSNRIFSNGDLGINLGPDYVTPNDPGDFDIGPNNYQNFPVLTSADVTGSSVTIEGSLNSGASQPFTIEFFSNGACDPMGYGEGENPLDTISVVTDMSGDASFTDTLQVVILPGSYITATATDSSGNTSEFSACILSINTPPGSNVAVQPTDSITGTTPVTVTFDSVEVAGNTTLTTTDSGPPVPGTFIVGDSATYYHLSTTADYTGTIEVCIEYDEATIPSPEDSLRLLHYDESLIPPDYVDNTTSLDTLLNIICGVVDSLSPFVLAVPTPGTGVFDHVIPSRYALYQNVPNPFNPSTVIRYDVPQGGGIVKLAIYDVTGRLIKTLVNEHNNAGRKRATWDGRNNDGVSVASGIYFYRMQAANFTATRKMLFLK